MIKKKWNEKKQKWIYGYDIQLRDPVTGKKTKRLRHYEFENRDDAETAASALIIADRNAKYGLRPVDTGPTLPALIEKRLAGFDPGDRLTLEKRILAQWQQLLPENIHVRDIRPQHIRLYVNRRIADGLRNSSIYREVTIIAAMLHQAGEFFTELEQWKVPKIPWPKTSKRRRSKVISEAEYRAVIAQLTRPLGPGERELQRESRVRVAQILHFAMRTAMRHSEILKLKWSNIDWTSDPPKAVVHQTKTDTDKHVPLTPLLLEILADRRQKQEQCPSLFVFTKTGQYISDFYDILRSACEACRIPYGRDVENGLILHAARHTVTTRLADSGLDLDTIGLITGHSAKHLIAYYTHYTPESVKRATKVLETIGGDHERKK